MAGAIVISLLAVAGFGLGLWTTGVVQIARRAMTMTSAGLSTMMDPELDDDAKEVAVRRAGLGLIRASFEIFWRIALALGAAAAPIHAADALGLAPRTAVFALMLRLDYIVVVSVAAILVAQTIRRRGGGARSAAPGADPYSATDRFFHELAFSSPAVLKTASWLEDRVIGSDMTTAAQAPIFITSLARGGTTALLNALHDVPGLATHIYRDMPFVTSPILWNRLSGGKRRAVERHQRAHGDGLEIDLDTPEAFEEVVWKLFWPDKYRSDGIDLWRPADRRPQAERFLGNHMNKIARARLAQGRVEAAAQLRYCSKNNANIARLAYLPAAFPGCRIVVPLRRPECHAASLLRQHLNFLRLHAEDDFIRRYMRDIGHFDFGSIHKPIRFPGFDAERHDPNTGDYWMNYWIHVFTHILENRERCIFVLQDDLRAAPQKTMIRLCDGLGIAPGRLGFESYFHAKPDTADTSVYSRGLFDEASDIYRRIVDLAAEA